MGRKDLRKNQKGITIIALVITIIVLLILAGISISMLTSDTGIINQATDSKKQTEQKGIEEQIDIAILQVEQEKRNPTMNDIINKLKSHKIIQNDSQVNKTTGAITITDPSVTIEGKLDKYIGK